MLHISKTMKKVYWELEIGDINQSCHHSCNTIKGSRSMHQVRSMLARDPTLIQFRQVSCACMSCADKNSDNECERATLVPSWRLSKLVPNDLLHVRGAILHQNQDEKIEFDTGGEYQIADDVQVGENIAIPSNDFDDSFWIMLVAKCVHVLAECLTHGWDNQYEIGGVAFVDITI